MKTRVSWMKRFRRSGLVSAPVFTLLLFGQALAVPSFVFRGGTGYHRTSYSPAPGQFFEGPAVFGSLYLKMTPEVAVTGDAEADFSSGSFNNRGMLPVWPLIFKAGGGMEWYPISTMDLLVSAAYRFNSNLDPIREFYTDQVSSSNLTVGALGAFRPALYLNGEAGATVSSNGLFDFNGKAGIGRYFGDNLVQVQAYFYSERIRSALSSGAYGKVNYRFDEFFSFSGYAGAGFVGRAGRSSYVSYQLGGRLGWEYKAFGLGVGADYTREVAGKLSVYADLVVRR